ncbi:MAG: glycosyltransferase family 4 protein [Candidatus Paceibacterota bacterium]
MKLLICTQKVDKEDDVLGFFHGWLVEFAKKAEKITVVCLEKGIVELPKNVEVFSLGKEKFEIGNLKFGIRQRLYCKINYLVNFYRYILQKRNEYDVVLVHMNKEYVLLGWKVWKLFGKKIVFWYNHKKGGPMASYAGFLSNKILYTSPDSFFAGNRKAIMTPVGIDTDIFKKNNNVLPKAGSFLCLGRISPVKNLETLIEAVKILSNKKNDFSLSFCGEAVAKDESYFEKMKKDSKSLQEKGFIKFFPAVANYKAPEIYGANHFLLNATGSGSMDKTIFEAMAMEMPVLASNIGLQKIWPEDLYGKFLFKENDADDLSQKMEKLLAMPAMEREEIGRKMRTIVLEKHSLSVLTEKLFFIFNELKR